LDVGGRGQVLDPERWRTHGERLYQNPMEAGAPA
jgi:hypothetical protein